MPPLAPIHRTCRCLAVALVAVALAASAPALAGATSYVLSGSGHAPKAGAAWTAVVRGGSATVSLDVVFGGQVVGHVASGRISHGVYRRTVRWPARSAGYPLVLRATVKGAGKPVRLEYAVKVRR